MHIGSTRGPTSRAQSRFRGFSHQYSTAGAPVRHSTPFPLPHGVARVAVAVAPPEAIGGHYPRFLELENRSAAPKLMQKGAEGERGLTLLVVDPMRPGGFSGTPAVAARRGVVTTDRRSPQRWGRPRGRGRRRWGRRDGGERTCLRRGTRSKTRDTERPARYISKGHSPLDRTGKSYGLAPLNSGSQKTTEFVFQPDSSGD